MTKKKSPYQRRLDFVRTQFNAEDLVRICSQQDFSAYGEKTELSPGREWHGQAQERFYYYRDNGAKILAVAHLDHIQDDPTCQVMDTLDGPLALSGALDDRLGAYVILELLPALGINVDILLTTGEESCSSTAAEFCTDKKYNWMIEFDRGGTDVVMYQYETDYFRALVRECGAHVGRGSYSDIAELENLDCAGFNWGVGYYDYHSKRAHAWLEDTFEMVTRFMKFHETNQDTHLEYWGDPRHQDGEEDQGVCPSCNEDDYWWQGVCYNCGHGQEVEDDRPLAL